MSRRKGKQSPFGFIVAVVVIGGIAGLVADQALIQWSAARKHHAQTHHAVSVIRTPAPAAAGADASGEPDATATGNDEGRGSLGESATPQATGADEATAAPEASTAPESGATPEGSSRLAPGAAHESPPPAEGTLPAAGAGGDKLAIIIDDCGQWLDTERALIALPVPITMSILPSVPYTSLIEKEAASAGKGIMLHLPMEPVSKLNPGPGKVTTEMSDDAITARVRDDLAQLPLARGVNNHEGSRATADARVMHDVVSVLAGEHRFFIDSMTASDSQGATIAAQAGLATASRDVFLDNVATVASVEAQLRQAAAIAQRSGSAIAIGHPRPATLAALRDMIPELSREGIDFVLAQDLVHQGAQAARAVPQPQRSADESGL